MAEDDTGGVVGGAKAVSLFDLLRHREAQAFEPSTRDPSVQEGQQAGACLDTAPGGTEVGPSPLHLCASAFDALPGRPSSYSYLSAPRLSRTSTSRGSKGTEPWRYRQPPDLAGISLTCVQPSLMALFEQGARDAGGVGAVELWLLKNKHASGPLVELHLRARWEDSDYVTRRVCETGEEGRVAAEYLRRKAPKVARPGQDLAGVLYSEVLELSVNRWRRLEDMAQDPLLPSSSRTSSSAKIFHLCGGAQVIFPRGRTLECK
mmetsp:Transcript_9423/g.16980  ORF Transcript_9423/g.16980 Transcript_9423/m.16980 type:complete len:262 (-) Transcript_9423:42-827(-)